MFTLNMFFVVLALVLLLLASFNIGHPRVNFGWLGLFFALLAFALK